LQGSYGAWLQGGSNNTLRGLRLRDLGSGGMRIGEGSIPSSQNSIVDCSIRDGGHVFFAGAGIHATRTDNNLIEGTPPQYRCRLGCILLRRVCEQRYCC